MSKRICVHVRRVIRSPVVQRTIRSGSLLKRHVVRGATIGLVPSTINDVAFHHAQLDITEVIHVTQDAVTLTTLNALASILLTVSKIL